ncbi:cell cycle regulator with zinc finger protein domain, putative, partial [Perkinsus marinus ATCC 50983]
MPDSSSSFPLAPLALPDREPARFLPVLFVCTIIFTLWAIYNFVNSAPELLWAQRGWIELIIFNSLFAMLLVCYTLCVVTNPGEVRKRSCLIFREKKKLPPWEDHAQEKKRSGARRHCKWCGKFKPDRCHHCRVCKRCVLKMDHHCPWIYNCVGFRNHKYFFLLLLYATLAAHFMWITMFESVVEEEEPLGRVFLLVFGMVLSSLFGLLLTAFFAFHIWLAFKAMTTIEYCEKSTKKLGFSGVGQRIVQLRPAMLVDSLLTIARGEAVDLRVKNEAHARERARLYDEVNALKKKIIKDQQDHLAERDRMSATFNQRIEEITREFADGVAMKAEERRRSGGGATSEKLRLRVEELTFER